MPNDEEMELGEFWTEEFAPKCMDDMVLTDELKAYFKNLLASKSKFNMLLAGSPGIGKTTIAKIVARDFLIIIYVCISFCFSFLFFSFLFLYLFLWSNICTMATFSLSAIMSIWRKFSITFSANHFIYSIFLSKFF